MSTFMILFTTIVAVEAFAQSNNCGSNSTSFMVRNQQDASSIVGACKVFAGDIVIESNADTLLDFGIVQTIHGTLQVNDDTVLTALTFTNLKNIDRLTLTNLSALTRLDLSALQYCLECIELRNLSRLETLSLEFMKSAGSLIIQSNPMLPQLQLQELQYIDGVNSTLSVENNTKLTVIELPRLIEISSGDANFYGTMPNLSFPSLTNIGGSMNVASTDEKFNCSTINMLKDSGIVKGAIYCAINASPSVGSLTTSISSTKISPTSDTSLPSGTGSEGMSSAPSSLSGDPTKTAIGFGVGFGVGLGVILLVFVGYVLWRNQRKRRRPQDEKPSRKHSTSSAKSEKVVQLPTHQAGVAVELPNHQAGVAVEFPNHQAGVAVELPNHQAGIAVELPNRQA